MNRKLKTFATLLFPRVALTVMLLQNLLPLGMLTVKPTQVVAADDVTFVEEVVAPPTSTGEPTTTAQPTAEPTPEPTETPAREEASNSEATPTPTTEPTDSDNATVETIDQPAPEPAPAPMPAAEGSTVDPTSHTWDVVELGKTYVYPYNDQVGVTFTKLPDVAGSLTIEEVTLSDEQVDALDAYNNVAYDITSSMENGSFEYTLKLPLPVDALKTARVVYAESVDELSDSSSVANESVSTDDKFVILTDLDHFTVFVVTNPALQANCDLVTLGTTAGATCFATIQEAINAANDGDEIIVGPGTYNENVLVNKNISLVSKDGAAATIIDGDTSLAGQGTIELSPGRNGVQIGASSKGFTILGIDGPPGIERSAIYLDDNQYNITIEGNIITARGDAALMGEYGLINNNIIINNNRINGASFNGADPAVGDQFVVPNVARQPVVFGAGTGSSTASNFQFTNNIISATAGNGSAGNNLVTLDLGGTNVIENNTFSGKTVGANAALRVRGSGAYTINQNNFTGEYNLAVNRVGVTVDATENWWNDQTGPAAVGSGAGKNVSANVVYQEWLCEPAPTAWVSEGGICTTPIVLDTPVQTGYNVNNGTLSPNTTPPLLACTNAKTNINGASVLWSDTNADSNIKYQRQYSTNNGASWGGNEIYTTKNTNFRTFGGGSGTEMKVLSRVRAFYDADLNGQLTSGEQTSAWSNTCDITYDKTAPAAPVIEFPNPEQNFVTTPILNNWTDVVDASGIKEYWVEYIYDDGHTFAGGPYRVVVPPQRNHSPGITEQGGVTIRVQAIDNAGNAGPWSEPRHYYYDSVNPTTPQSLSFETLDGGLLACGDTTNLYDIIAKWDASSDTTGISHYEYVSLNPPGGWEWGPVDVFDAFRPGAFTVGEGAYGFKVRAVDEAGNKSDWSNACDITYDTSDEEDTQDASKSAVIVHKQNQDGNPLPDWEMSLYRSIEPVVITNINVSNANGTTVDLPPGEYDVSVSGMYSYRSGSHGDADAAFSHRTPAEVSGPLNPYIEHTNWLNGYAAVMGGASFRGLTLRLNDTCTDTACFTANPQDGLVDWSATGDFATQSYSRTLDHSGGPLKFSVRDDNYTDNTSGNLSITITGLELVAQTTTDADGDAHFFDIPFGSYIVQEAEVEGWSTVSLKDGEALVCSADPSCDIAVDEETEYFTFTNDNSGDDQNNGGPESPTPQVQGAQSFAAAFSQPGPASPPVCHDDVPGSSPSITTVVNGVNSVTLTWSAVAPSTGYHVFMYSDSGEYSALNIGGTTATLTNLTGGGWTFEVMAVNGCATGPRSSIVGGTPTGGPVVGGPIVPEAETVEEGIVAGAEDALTEEEQAAALAALENGEVAGVMDEPCTQGITPWWPVIFLVVMSVLALVVETLMRGPSIVKVAILTIITGGGIGLFYWLANCNCTFEGETLMQILAWLCQWFWIAAILEGLLMRGFGFSFIQSDED